MFLTNIRSLSVVGDAGINHQGTRASRVGEVIDDLEVASLHARAWGDPLCLDLVSGGLENGPEPSDHPVMPTPW